MDFLRDPGRYRRLGAQIPHGVLLSGQPGTGKTLLAQTVAGEPDVPFSIIFIDELDAIGRARGRTSVGGNDEQEQTLNQILTEMDGFTGEEGVVVLAATNRADVLDPALLRPGRFDRRVTISAPDRAGRRQILAVHARNVPLAASVDLDALAAATTRAWSARTWPAWSTRPRCWPPPRPRQGDDAGLLRCAGEHLPRHGPRHRPVAGRAGEDRVPRIRAPLLGMLTPGADPVRKISIPPAGRPSASPSRRPSLTAATNSAAYLGGRITGALSARAAGEVVYGDITTGAENDLEHASDIARQMAGRWGLSPRSGRSRCFPHLTRNSPTASTASPGHQGTGGQRSRRTSRTATSRP